MAAWVRVSTVQQKDLSSNPSTHIKRWDVSLTLELCRPHTNTDMCAQHAQTQHTVMYAHVCRHAQTCMVTHSRECTGKPETDP